jgi:predicted nucleotidyltransferase component of viral defense system
VIPQAFIDAWRASAPWSSAALVEQDLVVSRAVVSIFSVPELREALAFRGGTALHKLHLAPGARYSEDIDLVQVRPKPIGPTFDRLRSALDPWLGEPKRVFKEGRVNLVYRFTSQENPPRPLRLKVEINSREHFSVLGWQSLPFAVSSDWFTGSADVTTFHLDELMGTKLRALYQRKKGRDLFDMAVALDRGADAKRVIACFQHYLSDGGHDVTRAQFEQNLHEKRRQDVFRQDMAALLRPGIAWHPDEALDRVLRDVVAQLPGDPWAGEAT